MQFLQGWKNSPNRKPLIIRGARQVGKTWLMKEFGQTAFHKTAYLNFESNSRLKELFNDNFDIKRILLAIQIESGVRVEPNTSLIILDEIQEAPGALTSLKYFQENAPEYHVISAGSLLGVAMNANNSFPVGKIEFLNLYPLSYLEFLEAMNEEVLADLIKIEDWQMIHNFKSRFIERLKQYYYVGGMPEAVMSFIQNSDFKEVREIQKRLLFSYEQDFSKHAPNDIVPRIRMVWNSIPAQLAKENKKFIYGVVKQGGRAKEFELALSWLIDSGLIYKINNISKPSIPLKAYEEFNAFKLFMVDVGLLSAMVDLDSRSMLDGNKIFQEFKGAFTEQYVLQQFIGLKDIPVYYWSAENSQAEIDFLLQITGKVIPVEVKAEENLRSKSLKVYYEKFSPETAIRTSMSDYRKETWMTNIPLYAISAIVLTVQ